MTEIPQRPERPVGPMVRLGKSDMRVTAVGFGGIPIQRLQQREAVRVIRHALDSGLNWIDTANAYVSSEERVGAALAGRDRRGVFLFTKGQGGSPEELRAQLELSLRRLRTDYLDLYQFHLVRDADAWQSLLTNGSFDLLRSYRHRGVVHHLGASAHTLEAALAVVKHPEIEVLQYPFNFIVEQEGLQVLEACRRHRVGFIAMKPFAGGVLGEAGPCIRFLLQHRGVATDPGFEQVEEVEEVVGLWRQAAPPSAAERETMRRLRAELGTRFCRRCGYCSPCPQDVQIISLMTMDSLIKRFPREALRDGWVAQAAASVEACTECGRCEERCPYHLEITAGVRRGAALWRQALGT